MVKKLHYLLLLIPFIFVTNVNAIQVGSLNGLNITQNENGTNVQYSLINDYFSYTQGTTRYIFSHSDNLMWKGISVTSDDEYTYTTNLNYYFTNPCSSSDNVSYNQRIAFFFVNTDTYPLNTLNVVNNINGCSGYWTKEDSTYYYNQTCSLPAGSSILGSLYFSEPNLGSWQVSNYRIGIQDDFDVKCEVNTNALIDNNNSNTQNIINNNTNNTNQIIQNNEQNTQDIIDNQNQNTQQEIESQKVCNEYSKLNIKDDNKFLLQNGTMTTNLNFGVTDYIYIKNATISVINEINDNRGARVCYYDINKQLIGTCEKTFNTIGLKTPPNDSYYLRFTIYKVDNRPIIKVCGNGNQALNDSVNDLNDTLKNDTPPDTANEISNLESDLISDTPISDLITMPLTLINAYINGLNSTCSPVNLGNLYGTNLIIPCIDIPSKIGNDLWGKIDVICCIFMCYEIGMLFITAFDGITSLRDDFEGLYQPRHADVGYQPKHGGGN